MVRENSVCCFQISFDLDICEFQKLVKIISNKTVGFQSFIHISNHPTNGMMYLNTVLPAKLVSMVTSSVLVASCGLNLVHHVNRSICVEKIGHLLQDMFNALV